MKYSDKLNFSLACMYISIQRSDVNLAELTRAELIGLWLLNEISETELKQIIDISDEELENLAKIILRINK